LLATLLLDAIDGLVSAPGTLAAFVGALEPSHPVVLGDLRWFVSIAVLAPWFEEVLYRGRLLGVFANHLGRVGASAATSALFAASHLQPEAMLAPLATGLLLAGVRFRTGSLRLCIGLHMGWNLGLIAGA
jgi:membrane protease YdiL (CAAX protease family)